jgi:threonyl-tRNA synthetase
VVGDKEIEAGTVAVRDRAGTEVRGVHLDAFIARALDELETKAIETGPVEDLG